MATFLKLVGTYIAIGIAYKIGEDLWENYLRDKVMDIAEEIKKKKVENEKRAMIVRIES